MKIWTRFTMFSKLILFRNVKGCLKRWPVLHGSLSLGELVTEEIQDGSTRCDSSIVTLVLYLCFGDDDKDFFSVWKDQESEWAPISAAISVGNALPIRYSWRRGKIHWVNALPLVILRYTSQVIIWMYCLCLLPSFFAIFFPQNEKPPCIDFLYCFHAIKQVLLEYPWFSKPFS